MYLLWTSTAHLAGHWTGWVGGLNDCLAGITGPSAPAFSAMSALLAKGKLSFDLNRILEWMDIGFGGYFVLFGLLFSCGLGVPLPEDIPLLVAGALVGNGKMYLPYAAIAAWMGIIGGDCMLYMMARRYGLNITKVPVIGTHVTKERILKAEKLFKKYGILVVGVGRMFAGIRGAMVIAAGTTKFNFIKFIIADGIAAVVSGGLFVYLGKKFGEPERLRWISAEIHRASGWVLAVAAGAVLLLVLYVWFRRARHHTPSDEVLNLVASRVKIPAEVESVETPTNEPHAPAGSTLLATAQAATDQAAAAQSASQARDSTGK